MRSMTARVRVFLLTLLTVWTLTSCGAKQAPPGTVVAAEGTGGHAYVMTPLGRLDVTVSEPTADLPAGQRYERAADGASFIAVSWAWDLKASPVTMAAPENLDELLDVAVIAEGKHSLMSAMVPSPDASLDLDGVAWVSVEGDPKDLEDTNPTIEVTFDGVKQTVQPNKQKHPDLDGFIGASLYGDPAAMAWKQPRRCEVHEPGADLYDACEMSWTGVPYYEPVGWASNASGWTVVSLSASIERTVRLKGGQEVTISQKPVRATYRLGETAPHMVVDGPINADIRGRLIAATAIFPGTSVPVLRVEGTYTTVDGQPLRLTWLVS